MDVGGWLRSLGLGQYEALFRASEIDADILPELTEIDLEKLGVPLGHRKRLLRAISGLTAAETSAAPSASTGAKPHDAAERRQLTVMFCDLVGSTALSTRFDPEELREEIRAYQNAVSGVVARYDGFVAKFMGDGVLAYFGYPRAHEDDAERAVRAGLEIAAAVTSLETRGTERLAVRIGIATGLVVVGDLVGEGSAQEQAVVGETPNLAARLQALARTRADRPRRRHPPPDRRPVPAARPRPADGQGLRRAGRGLRGRGRRRDGEPLRGGAPRAHRPRRPGGGERPVARPPARGLGRRRPDRLALGRGRHRQVAARRSARRRGRERAAHAAALSMLALSPRQRPAPLCRGSWGAPPASPPTTRPETQLDKLEAILAPARIAETAPLFASLLSIPTGDRYPPLALSAAQQRRLTLAALLDQLEALARQKPVLMLFEDAHWADATSLEVLDLTVERVRALPVLVLITFRPEYEAPWTGLSHVTSIALDRLAPAEVETLAEHVAGRPLPPEVTAQIVAKTDGVPLFVEELTKTVLESGLLVAGPQGWRLDGPLPPFAIPATLQDSLAARLDRLAPVKEIAQIGAAIGREFSYPLLRAVAGRDEPALRAALAQLEEAELLFRSGAPPDARYTFKHALVQDTAYETLLRSRRQILHRQIADALRGEFPAVAAAEPELVAHHLTQAGLDEPAIEWWGKAGDQALRRSAFKEAAAHLGKAIELADKLAATAPSAAPGSNRLRLQTSLGNALIWAKGYHGAGNERGLCARPRTGEPGGRRLGTVLRLLRSLGRAS